MNLLGKKVRDKINGMVGIATSRTQYLNGCVRYGVTPPADKEGKPLDAYWIDEEQLEVIGDGPVPARDPSPQASSYSGGDRPGPEAR